MLANKARGLGKHLLVLVATGGTLLLAVQPLLLGHVPWRGDGLLHFYRLGQLERTWHANLFYPRWLPDLGYGYGFPLFNYYAPFSYYVVLGPRLLGLSLAVSLQLGYGLALALLATAAYLWARDLWRGSYSAVTAVVAAIYSPYVLYNVYHRAALAELWGLGWLLLTLWAAHRLARAGQWRSIYLPVAALSYAALILSHNITALIGTPVIIGYGLLAAFQHFSISAFQRSAGQQNTFNLQPSTFNLQPLTFIPLALALSAFFWLPALGEQGAVQIENLYASASFAYENNFLPVNELLAVAPTADPDLVNPPIPRSLGWPQIILAMLAWLPAGALTRSQQVHRLALTVAAIACTFMALALSRPLWEALPLLHFVQFPWRFLGPASLALALLAALGVERVVVSRVVVSRQSSGWQGLALRLLPSIFYLLPCLFILLFALPLLFPGVSPQLPVRVTPVETIRFEIETGWLGTTAAADYLPRAVQQLPAPQSLLARYERLPAQAAIPRLEAARLPVTAKILEASYGLTKATLVIQSSEAFTAEFDWFYFPGWRAWLDGQPLPLAAGRPHGLITAEVPSGVHTLHLEFATTPLRQVATVISWLGLVAFVTLLITRLKETGTTASHPDRKDSHLSVLICVLLLFSVKTLYLDQADTVFRRSAFDGQQVQGVDVPLQVNFGDELMLLGADLPAQPAPADQLLDLALYWRILPPVTGEYSVGVHLVDGQGRRYGQHDSFHPANYPVPRWQATEYGRDGHRLAIWPGTPPGRYTLRLFVYERESGRRLEVLNADGLPLGVTFDIADVVVAPPARFPAAEEVEMGVRQATTLADGIELLGFDLPVTQVEVGQVLPLVLYWRTPVAPDGEYDARLRLASRTGETVAVALPAHGDYVPGAAWQAGQIGRDLRDFLIPAQQAGHDAPVLAGRYSLQLELWPRGGNESVGTVALATIDVTVPERAGACPEMARPLSTRLGEFATLTGYSLNSEQAAPGETITLRLCWRADGVTETSYTIFVQALGPDGRIYGQQDQIPGGGARPTSGWYTEFIADTYQLTIDPDAPPGVYQIIVGMYDSDTGARLPVQDQTEDFVALPTTLEVKTRP